MAIVASLIEKAKFFSKDGQIIAKFWPCLSVSGAELLIVSGTAINLLFSSNLYFYLLKLASAGFFSIEKSLAAERASLDFLPAGAVLQPRFYTNFLESQYVLAANYQKLRTKRRQCQKSFKKFSLFFNHMVLKNIF